MELKKNDIISYLAIIISIIALGLSYFTFYHTELRVSHNIQVSCIKNDIITHKVLSENRDSLLIPIVFKNMGNQSEIILESQIRLHHVPKEQLKLTRDDNLMIVFEASKLLDSLLRNFKLDNMGGIHLKESNKFTIAEGEIKELNKKIGFPFFNLNLDDGERNLSSDLSFVGLYISYMNELGKQSDKTFTIGVIGIDKGFLLYEFFKAEVFNLF